jgi:beta-lactamase superfamily II metal-dependent hydrolase
MLLFGCGGQTPGSNGTGNTTQINHSNGTAPVTIIIGGQKNQTTQQNYTDKRNETPPPAKRGINYTEDPNQPLGVYMIYVGDTGLQGEAILIKKGDFDVLVDAGPADKAGKVVDFLKSKGVDDIEILISTTGDPRRYGGITAVAENFKVESYWWPGVSYDRPDYSAIANRLEGTNTQVIVPKRGYNTTYDGINLVVLNPDSGMLFNDVNNDAMVIRLANGDFTMLLTSDIQTGAQGRLIGQYPDLIKTKVLDAPYYGVGSGTANIGVFLNTAKPDAVVISGSADESAANGGSRDPFRRLMNMSQYKIKYYENYKNGTLRITVNGGQYLIDSLGS